MRGAMPPVPISISGAGALVLSVIVEEVKIIKE
jgi:hypothetical protein